MPKDITLGVRLTADGKGFVGGITVGERALRRLRGETDKTAASTRGVSSAMRQAESAARSSAAGFLQAHGHMAKYVSGFVGVHQLARALGAVRDNSIRQEQAMAQVEARIRSTGGAAGITAAEIAEMAAALQESEPVP